MFLNDAKSAANPTKDVLILAATSGKPCWLPYHQRDAASSAGQLIQTLMFFANSFTWADDPLKNIDFFSDSL
jgi:hypothetical protein